MFISDITEKHEQRETDIAEHKAVIKTLSETNERLEEEKITSERVAQALAGDYFSIYILDPDTDYYEEYSSNEEYGELGVSKKGYDFFDMSATGMDKVIWPDDLERYREVFTKDNIMSIIQREGNFTYSFRMDSDGEEMFVSLKATLTEDQQSRHLIMGISDITPQVKREREYEQSVTEAKAKARNDFLANMSHDIRTPMNAIMGYTHIASENINDHVLVKESLDKIGSSSHFLLSLINDILDISKIENGMMQLHTVDMDLSDVFSRIEDITSLQARNKSLEISYDHSTVRHTKVRGDELRIEQILINITSNAIKYNSSGAKRDTHSRRRRVA